MALLLPAGFVMRPPAASAAAVPRFADRTGASQLHKKAVEEYRRALKINPRYVFAWSGLGRSLAVQLERIGRGGDAPGTPMNGF